MPVEVAIWRLGETVERITMSALDSENMLERTIETDLSVISSGLMLIGRQVATGFGTFIDLLAMDSEGNLKVIELKKKKTPREVVAQTLDYASWVQNLSFDEIANIYAQKNAGRKLQAGFEQRFGFSLPDEVNQNHELIIVASELDTSTERIINYLGDRYGVPINAVFFRHFRDGERQYLARSWLIDPQEAEAKADKAAINKGKEPWNGRDFYVSFGERPMRAWADAQRYGFVSGGGGKWHSQTLDNLFPGARVFVNLPGAGYVGVGTVKEEAAPVKEFTVEVDGKRIPILDAPLEAENMGKNADDPELCEYLVRVEWIKTLRKEEAYWETGLFAIQHTACRMRSQFTIERLSKRFGLEDE